MQHVEARAGAYADSVTLMQVTARAQAVGGVQAALVAMGTELNLELLAGLGLPAPDRAGQNDLIIAIAADDGESLASALTVVDSALAARPADQTGGEAVQPPRTTLSAARRAGPGLALISVPGQHAFAEAADALDADCDVMIFSDNVPVEQEIVLKDRAAERGLLVLGPDCGTAIVGGIGLGFSHSVPAGPIGLVAASGTGAQQVICLLDAAGAGVSAVLGVGGRDLSAAVGGRSARAALAALDDDPGTELIVLLSKPPAADVAAEVMQYAAGLATPVQFALIGPGQPDLTAAAEAALRAIGQSVPEWPSWPPTSDEGHHDGGVLRGTPGPEARSRPAGPSGPASRLGGRPPGQALRGTPGGRPPGQALRGLFAGGTLRDEAMIIAAERLGQAGGYVMIDFGDDELTAGRPHPMIDQRLRLARLAAESADPQVAVILLDVVLGHGAHPDPASELAPAIAAALAGREAGALAVVVSLIGARSDPQGLAGQAAALAGAGAHVFASNAQAARLACEIAAGAAAGGAA